MVRYQLASPSRYIRPVTIFACHRAATGDAPSDHLIPATAAVELFYHYAAILDDIIDRDRYRGGKLALHCRYGRLPAIMTSAYFAFAAAGFLADDPYANRVFAVLGKQIAALECRQWTIRRHPFGVDVWRETAGASTGRMFQSCARVATRDDGLARFGYLVGTLYHGCDDVADLRGALGAGRLSERDIVDRVLTLPAAIATDDPETAQLFAEPGPKDELASRLTAALPEAEAMLDEIATAAAHEARDNALAPEGLLDLLRFTRELANV